MAARDTYIATVASSEATKAASLLTAQTSFQETINASGCNSGFNTATGTSGYTAYASAVAAANKALVASRTAAEQARQAAVAVARDTLRNSGDGAPF